MRSDSESNSINRVLKARGLPSLDEPGVIVALARLVEDHTHFEELLRACDPTLRREMYEAMKPHLRFVAGPLEDYIIRAKMNAQSQEFPVMDEQGFLHPFRTPSIVTVEVPAVELWAKCGTCGKEGIFLGSTKADAVFTLRASGWGWDEFDDSNTICVDCLDAS